MARTLVAYANGTISCCISLLCLFYSCQSNFVLRKLLFWLCYTKLVTFFFFCYVSNCLFYIIISLVTKGVSIYIKLLYLLPLFGYGKILQEYFIVSSNFWKFNIMLYMNEMMTWLLKVWWGIFIVAMAESTAKGIWKNPEQRGKVVDWAWSADWTRPWGKWGEPEKRTKREGTKS